MSTEQLAAAQQHYVAKLDALSGAIDREMECVRMGHLPNGDVARAYADVCAARVDVINMLTEHGA